MNPCETCNNTGEREDHEGQIEYCSCDKGQRLLRSDALVGAMKRRMSELKDLSVGFEVKNT